MQTGPTMVMRVAGYSIDLAEALSKEVGFEYRFKLVEDNNYGMKSPVNGTWIGMIGELVNKVSRVIWSGNPTTL